MPFSTHHRTMPISPQASWPHQHFYHGETGQPPKFFNQMTTLHAPDYAEPKCTDREHLVRLPIVPLKYRTQLVSRLKYLNAGLGVRCTVSQAPSPLW